MSAHPPASDAAASSAEQQTIEIIFDGGSLRNPGDGYGSYCIKIGDTEPRICRLVFGRATNNEAEYKALIAGLEDAVHALEARGTDPRRARVTIRGDSQLVLEQVRGRWKVRAAHLQPLRDRAADLVGRFGRAELLWHPRAESVRVLGH